MIAPANPPAGLTEPYLPRPYAIAAVQEETANVRTYTLEARNGEAREREFRPGQFNMILLPGVGEVAISIAGDPRGSEGLRHTIRSVGRVTGAIARLKPGALLGVRGPYGSSWPVESAFGLDLLMVTGGLGLAPLRPALKAATHARDQFRRLILVYGARTPEDMLYTTEYESWSALGVEIHTTVDRAGRGWRGAVGVVTAILPTLDLDPAATRALVCGPEVMMRSTVSELQALGVDPRHVSVSLERNMQCAVGLCGHCQLGPEFLCADGPVFPFPRVARWLAIPQF